MECATADPAPITDPPSPALLRRAQTLRSCGSASRMEPVAGRGLATAAPGLGAAFGWTNMALSSSSVGARSVAGAPGAGAPAGGETLADGACRAPLSVPGLSARRAACGAAGCVSTGSHIAGNNQLWLHTGAQSAAEVVTRAKVSLELQGSLGHLTTQAQAP